MTTPTHSSNVTEQMYAHPANQGAATYQNGYGQNGYTGGATRLHESSSDDASPTKEKDEDLETVHTNERVGSHENYYEKGGLRTEGDGQDHVGSHHKVGCAARNNRNG